jgi:hypothetical protein
MMCGEESSIQAFAVKQCVLSRRIARRIHSPPCNARARPDPHAVAEAGAVAETLAKRRLSVRKGADIFVGRADRSRHFSPEKRIHV